MDGWSFSCPLESCQSGKVVYRLTNSLEEDKTFSCRLKGSFFKNWQRPETRVCQRLRGVSKGDKRSSIDTNHCFLLPCYILPIPTRTLGTFLDISECCVL